MISGCTSRRSHADIASIQNSDAYINAIITAPTQAYFDTEIEFDASKSYANSGEINNYIWNFMNGESIEGKVVKHTFEFNNDYNTKFPLIYTVSLFVVDNNKNIYPCIHHIVLYPKNYYFYFSSQEISSIKPMSHSEKISSNKIFDLDFSKNLFYELPETINIPTSNWDLNLEIEKPFFSIIRSVSVSFFDETDKKILEETQRLGFNPFWLNKNIVLTGTLDKNVNLKSVRIGLSGFRLNNINIMYGSEDASGITFNVK
jgi:hypothetical protein